MTKTYRLTPITRVTNGIFSVMTRRGRGANYRYILTVEGRKSGVAKSTPVDVMEVDGQRWLVAPYGEVNWVKNARASGQAELSRGGTSSRWKAEEVRGLEAVSAIRCYITSVPSPPPTGRSKPTLPTKPSRLRPCSTRYSASRRSRLSRPEHPLLRDPCASRGAAIGPLTEDRHLIRAACGRSGRDRRLDVSS
jgi:deazaflavin-dependent oxidoreductase (nitroreductase family)